MQLEDYFHSIQQEKPMTNKDTHVYFSISQDNSDLEDFPNTSYNGSWDYSDVTWIQVLEDVIKILEAQYGYDIKSKVFYSTAVPLFDHNYSAAPGRELKADLFNKLLEENPELNNGGKHQPINW